jgi:hypothetical protein
MADDRRVDLRLPVEICVHHFLSEGQYLGLTRDVSEKGIYVSRLPKEAEDLLTWQGRLMQLEFSLPGTGEMIWAKGQVCYNDVDGTLHGLGIRLTAMAERHRRALREYVDQVRHARLHNLLLRVQRNRRSGLPGVPHYYA